MGTPPYQAALVDATHRVTPGPWREFFASLVAGAVSGSGSSEPGAGIIGIGMDGDAVGASVAEMLSFLPPPAPSVPAIVSSAMPFVESVGLEDARQAALDEAASCLRPPDPRYAAFDGLTAFRVPFVSSVGGLDDDPAFAWDDTNKRLVFATGGQSLDSPPTNENPHLHVGGDYNGVAAGIGALMVDGYGAQPNITMRRADGTQASKSALSDTGIVFNFRSYGYDGAAFGLGGLMRMVANGAQTGTNHGQDWVLLLTANGSAAAPTEVLRMTGAGVLAFAGKTASQVGLKRSTTVLQTRLADDSAFAQHSALEFMSNRANFLIRTAVAWTNGAGALAGTLGNAPAAGNPTKWIPVDDNGTTRYVPAW